MLYSKAFFVMSMFFKMIFAQKEKVSVTFVIDDTSSMSADIKQVKNRVTEIFDTVTNSVDSHVENFVLVTFNDHLELGHEPEHLITTLDRYQFLRKLALIFVEGGGDCPEMAMSGIQLGIDKSLPGSYLYVFTDAVAKDHDFLAKIRNLAIKKEIQIVFIITPSRHCVYSKKDPGYLAYHELAKATSGQVFHMEKDDVGEIMAFVEETIRARKEPIISKTFPPGYGHEFGISVDGDMKDVVIAESGKDADIHLTSPDGTKTIVEKIVNIDNAKVVKIVNPKPGNYTAKCGSKSNTSVVVTAESGIGFNHGFSVAKPTSMNDTSIMPLSGVQSYLSIQLIGEDEVNLDKVELIGMDEKKISEIPLKILDAGQKIYITDDKILPEPDKLFKIAIKGLHVKSNTNFTRFSRTPIEVQKIFSDTLKSMSPTMEVNKVSPVKVTLNDTLNLVCKVKGHPKPEITWTDEMGNIYPTEVTTITLPYDHMAALDIINVDKNMTYKCEAHNVHGGVSKIIKVELDNYFNVLEKPKDTSVEYMNSGKINCKIDAYPPAETKWYKNDVMLETNEFIEITSSSNILVIKKMLPDLVGGYVCLSKNDFKSEELKFELHMSETAPIISIDGPNKIEAEYNKPLSLTCLANGNPKPQIVWIDDSTNEELTSFDVVLTNNSYQYQRVLSIDNINQNSTYKCKASNLLGEDSASVKVEIAEYLKVIERPKNTNITYMESGKVTCKVDAKPPANVTWYKNNVTLLIDDNFEILEGSYELVVKKMLPNLAGEYSCMVNNAIKSEEIKFELSILGSAPKASIDGPDKIEVEYDTAISLNCRVTGHPKPLIVWYDANADEELLSFEVSEEEKPYEYRRVLKIERVNKNAVYKCKATNSFGEQSVNVTVETLEYFKIVEPPKNTTIAYKKEGKIFCRIAAKPQAVTIWLHNKKPIEKNEHFDISADNTTLTIRNMQPSLFGYYYCQLSNIINHTNLMFKVSISGLVGPVIDKSVKSLDVLEESSVDIPCKILQGIPTPTITWGFKADNEEEYKEIEGTANIHRIDNVSRDQSGSYRCVAKNKLRPDSHTVVLTVEYPPVVVEKPETNIIAENRTKVLLKCLTRGKPEPSVTWFFNGVRIGDDEKYQVYRDHSISFIATADLVGVFNCSATNKHGEDTISTNVSIYDPVVMNPPLDTKFETSVGKHLELPCVAHGYPSPTIKWIFYNSSDNSSDPLILKTGVSPDTLELRNLQLNQDGYYTCVARNEVPSQSNLTYTVNVYGKPEIVDVITNVIEVIAGDTFVRVPCVAIGRPKPTITWLNEEELNVLTGSEWYDMAEEGALIIKNIDEGDIFTCVAENRVGSARESFQVIVRDYPHPSNPVADHKLTINESAEVICPLAHTRVDVVRWYKGASMVSDKDSQVLKFNSVSPSDAGIYTCRVSSSTAAGLSASIQIVPIY